MSFAAATRTLIMLAIGGLVMADVVGREWLDVPLPAVVDWVRLLLVLMIFIALPTVVASNRLLRVDTLVAALPARWRKRVNRAGIAISSLTLAVIGVTLALATWTSFHLGERVGLAADDPPAWPLRLLAAILTLLAAGIALRQAWRGRAGDDS